MGTSDTGDPENQENKLFKGKQVAFEFSPSAGFKQKKHWREAVTKNGGVVSFILTAKVRMLHVLKLDIIFPGASSIQYKGK